MQWQKTENITTAFNALALMDLQGLPGSWGGSVLTPLRHIIILSLISQRVMIKSGANAYVSRSPVRPVSDTPHARRLRTPGNVHQCLQCLRGRSLLPFATSMWTLIPPFCSSLLAIMSGSDLLRFHMWNTCFVSV